MLLLLLLLQLLLPTALAVTGMKSCGKLSMLTFHHDVSIEEGDFV